MRFAVCFGLSLTMHLACSAAAVAGGDDADKKTIRRIVQEIELVPLLYAHDEAAVKIKSLPKFSAKKLADYGVDKKESLEKERERWKAGKEEYAKLSPLRAAVFEAAEAEVKVPKMSIGRDFSPKHKAAFLDERAPLGMRLFKLEQLYVSIMEAQEKREEEKSKRWQANFDMATMRLLSNMIFHLEYNYTLHMIRANALPKLGPEHDGWKIGLLSKLTVTEKAAKGLAKERSRLLTQMQERYPDTPWAYFAERETKRELGMTWVPKKK